MSTIVEEYTELEVEELQEAKTHQIAVQASAPPAVAPADNGAATLMAMVEKLAMMPNLDESAMRRIEWLMEKHEQMLSRRAEQIYYAAMATAQNEIQVVEKNKKNNHTHSSYADLAAIHEAAKPVWTRHGFSVSSWIEDSDKPGMIRVLSEVGHSGGHKRTYANLWPLDDGGMKGNSNKTPIQAMGSSSSYARRYTECMIFDIATKDDDGNGPQAPKSPAHQRVTNAQIRNLREKIKAADVTEEWFCGEAQISRIEELLQGRLRGCIGVLDELIANRRGKV